MDMWKSKYLISALVSKSTRDSEKFIVNYNIEPGDKVRFTLTYDELLERSNGYYQYAININPKQIIQVNIYYDD